MYNENEEGTDDDDEEEEDERVSRVAAHKARWGNRFGRLLSAEMQAFVGAEEMDRRMVVKEIWRYIKVGITS